MEESRGDPRQHFAAAGFVVFFPSFFFVGAIKSAWSLREMANDR